MPCAEFEERLLDYANLRVEERLPVEAHLKACAECRAFLEALSSVDVALARGLGGLEVSPGFRRVALERAWREVPLRKPSFVPEILDFVGWAAVVAIVMDLLYRVRPLLEAAGM